MYLSKYESYNPEIINETIPHVTGDLIQHDSSIDWRSKGAVGAIKDQV